MGEHVLGRTAFDLNTCRHAVPNRRLLADRSWEDPRRWAGRVAAADGRQASGSDDVGAQESPTSAPDRVRRGAPPAETPGSKKPRSSTDDSGDS
jgi:hypothetical protein